MKKIYSLLLLMLLCSTGAWAADLQATFGTDFSSSKWTTVTDGEEYYMVVGDIKLTLKKGTAVTALTQGMTTGHLRVYKGASITFTSFKGDISEVAFTISGNYPATNFTVDGTNLTGSSWTGEEEEVTFVAKDGQVRASTIVVTYSDGTSAPTIALPEISGATPFIEQTEVTISCSTDGASIYYTTDGTDPTANSTPYSDPFNITESCTVKAVAVLNSRLSQIASKEFVKAENPLMSISEFNNLEDADGSTVNAVFGVPVTAIAQAGNYLYAQDASAGILIYGNVNQTYTMGDMIPAGFSGRKITYKGAPEMAAPLANFKAAEGNIQLEPMEVTRNELTVDNAFRYGVIRNATVASGVIKDASGATIPTYNRFNVAVPDDGTYDIYGVTGWFDDGQFMPLEYKDPTPPKVLHSISKEIVGEGTINLDISEAYEGDDVSFSLTAAPFWYENAHSSYYFIPTTADPVIIGESYWTTGADEGYSFIMPDYDVTIHAEFVETPLYGISVNVENATVDIEKTAAHEGERVDFTVNVDPEHTLDAVTVTYVPGNETSGDSDNAIEVECEGPDANNGYYFNMPAGRVTISVKASGFTGITNVHSSIVGVTYVNMQGVESDRPFEGLNIVLSRHADGSVTAVKVVK